MGYQPPGSGLGGASERKVEASLRLHSPLKPRIKPKVADALAVAEERKARQARDAERKRQSSATTAMERMAAKRAAKDQLED